MIEKIRDTNSSAAIIALTELSRSRKMSANEKYRILDLKRDINFSSLKDYNAAHLCADSALEVLKPLLDDQSFAEYYAKTLFLKGDIFFAEQNFLQGVNFYTLASHFIEDHVDDKCTSNGYYNRLGNILYAQEKFKDAARYYQAAVNQTIACEPDSFARYVYVQLNLDNTGLSYMNDGKFDSARIFFDSAMRYIIKNEYHFPDHKQYNELAKAVVKANKGELLTLEGRSQSGLELLRNSTLTTSRADTPFYQATLSLIASTEIRNSNFSKARETLKILEESLHRSKNDKILVQLYNLQSRFYMIFDSLQAYPYLRKYIALKEENDKRKIVFDSFNIFSELQTTSQNLKQELHESNRKIEIIYTWIMIAGFILLLLLIAGGFKIQRHLYIHQQKNLFKLFNLRKIIRSVAHDLKNPIAGINTLVSGLSRKVELDSYNKIFNAIKNACRYADSTIKDVLGDTKRMEVDIARTELAEIVRFTVELLLPAAEQKEQVLNVNASTKAYVNGTSWKVWRIITNLITNAIKFSPHQSVINIKIEANKGLARLIVEDTGIGIPDQLKEKLFNAQKNTGRKGTIGEESHGLGLISTKDIVASLKGKIWFESAEGKGSIFYVELPTLD